MTEQYRNFDLPIFLNSNGTTILFWRRIIAVAIAQVEVNLIFVLILITILHMLIIIIVLSDILILFFGLDFSLDLGLFGLCLC